MSGQSHVEIFERVRPMLLGLAYRILGSGADAEDAVQDAFLKWRNSEIETIDNPASWLTTVCTRRCIDMLRAAHRTRVDYVGAWLPEPIHALIEDESEHAMTLSSSLSTAFLLMLERLTPRERAAYLLHDIFENSYAEIASILAMQETACRKLVSRARDNIGRSKARHVISVDKQEELLAAFQAAIQSGDTSELAALFADDIEIRHDSGKAPAAIHVLRGKDDVVAFVRTFLHRAWRPCEWVAANLNGGRGAILQKGGAISAAISFGYDDEGRTTNIYIMRNPDKLSRLSVAAIH